MLKWEEKEREGVEAGPLRVCGKVETLRAVLPGTRWSGVARVGYSGIPKGRRGGQTETLKKRAKEW